MSKSQLHLVKLCVGAATVQDLVDWQATVRARNSAAGFGQITTHTTRMWPRREAELLDGGALYWVFKGVVLARQNILALEPRDGADGIRRCAIVLEDKVVRTAPQPRRPFQGWRYLTAEDAPRDLEGGTGHIELPLPLEMALNEIGVR